MEFFFLCWEGTRGRSAPLTSVLHRKCWAQILPVLWLVFLPKQTFVLNLHLVFLFCFCFVLFFGCICWEDSWRFCPTKRMWCRRNDGAHLCRFTSDQWRDSSQNVYSLPTTPSFLKNVSSDLLYYACCSTRRNLCWWGSWYIYNKCKPLRKSCNA